MDRSGNSDKRKQILKAAVKVFSQKGFHEAKVEEIARLADVGKGTVYEYFSSKTELFQEMFKAGIQFYLDKMMAEIKPGHSCAEKLTRIARLHIRFAVSYRDLARVTMAEHAHFNEDFRQWIWENRNQKLKMIEEIIKDGISQGEFRQVDPQAAALAFAGALGALLTPAVLTGGRVKTRELVDPVLEVLFKGLSAGR